MIEAQADSDPVNVPPAELEAIALDAISSASYSGLDAAEERQYEPIAIYCDRSALDLPARLRIFQRLCRAVHAAHQRGTIFGDLDPRRLRTTADGTDVVIASPAEVPGGAASIEACTSPEQVLGEPATTASDVYALGVALYELLTGRYPYQIDVGDPSALAKAISEESAERPSVAVARTSGRPDEADAEESADAVARATTGRKLRAAMAGDLDLIALKALHKEPERRYASADALADDLDRYLQGLPVRAHAPSELYRVGKFLKRRRWVGAVGASLFVAAVVAGVLGVRAISTARRERDRADRLYQSARASVHDVYMRLAEDRPRDSEDVASLRRDLLDGVSRYYEDFNTANSAEPEAAADVAEARTRSAMIARATGLKREAEAGFREASELWRRLIAASPAEDAYRERLAKVQAELGRSLDADGKIESQPDEALAAFESARSLLTPLVDARPDARPLRRELARVLRDEAGIHDRRDRAAPADELLRRAIRLQEELVWENPHDLDARMALASAYGFMARIEARRASGRRGARAALERAIEVLNEAPEASAADVPPRLAFETAQRLIDLAGVERSVDATREAAGHAGRAVAILESLTTRRPNDLVYQEGLAAAYNVVGELFRNQGALTPALEAARKARAVLDRLLIEQPRNASHTIELSTTHQLLGRTQAQLGKYAEAFQSFQRAVDLLEGRNDLDAMNQYNLASALSLGLVLIGAKDGSPPPAADKLSPADTLRRRLYADRAVVALRQAVAKGFNQLEVYRTDTALDPLRSREDFQKLLADLAAAEKP